MTRCTEPGCLRKPAYPDQSKCEVHRITWEPAWRRWTREHGAAKETTRSAA